MRWPAAVWDRCDWSFCVMRRVGVICRFPSPSQQMCFDKPFAKFDKLPKQTGVRWQEDSRKTEAQFMLKPLAIDPGMELGVNHREQIDGSISNRLTYDIRTG